MRMKKYEIRPMRGTIPQIKSFKGRKCRVLIKCGSLEIAILRNTVK